MASPRAETGGTRARPPRPKLGAGLTDGILQPLDSVDRVQRLGTLGRTEAARGTKGEEL